MRSFLRNKDGAAAVEFGLIAPIVVAVLVGIATTGGVILAYNKMRQAVSGGAQYAMTVSSDDTSAIRDVVLAAWEDKPASAQVNVVQACMCGDVVSVCDVICGASTTDTSDDDYPEKTTTITASMTYAGFGEGARTLTVRDEVRTW